MQQKHTEIQLFDSFKLANSYSNNSKEINKKLFSFTGWWKGCYQEVEAKVSSQFTLLNIDEGTLKI